jgi:aryl-alcohol dehydrogenase-like predicted oxidoreductase
MTDKLVLGGAQLGMDYGVSNKDGKPTQTEISAILNLAKSSGINTIDTAPVYGNCEELVGRHNLNDFNLITKTFPISQIKSNEPTVSYLSDIFDQSLQNLGLKKIHGLLVHHIDDLLGAKSSELYDWLANLKALGFVEKIGISVYTENEINQVTKNFNFDIIQLPMNIFDQRLLQAGTISKLSNLGIEIHCRSVFLQGLLLMDISQLPKYFHKYRPQFEKFALVCQDLNKSPLEVCLGYLMSISSVDKIIVGVNRVEQLQEIINSSSTNINLNSLSCLASDDIGLIDVRKWN